LKELNEEVYRSFPDVQTIAEESTAFPKVSRPTFDGGLGFGMKWMMGWMHDTLEYFGKEPIYRKYHQNDITFSLAYAFTENFMLPLSHDEVVYGKQSILGRMPGDEWQKFANLRLLYGYMFTHPGAKLLFMGGEFGQHAEWDFQSSLDWNLLEYDVHQNTQHYFKELNKFYKNSPALFEHAFTDKGFEWLSYADSENSVICYLRKGYETVNDLLVVCNFTPQVLNDYKIGVPHSMKVKEVFNSDADKYGGSGVGNPRQINSKKETWNGKEHTVKVTLAPLSISIFKIK
jgi:1,4-alpha-glucan branching enzyme